MDKLLTAVEMMALDLGDSADADFVSTEDMERWKELFGFHHEEAKERIIEHRNNLDKHKMSDVQWASICQNHPQHNKESYLYMLRRAKDRSAAFSRPSATSSFLIKLDGPSQSLLTTKLGLNPTIIQVKNEKNETEDFVLADGIAMPLIVHLFEQELGYCPKFLRLSIANKDLSAHSPYPTLGIDTSSLPQFRLDGCNNQAVFRPGQNEYPVRYFFYGTLCEPDRVMSLLSLTTEPRLERAVVFGGEVMSWAGKYRALVDADTNKTVRGYAFWVESQEQELPLRLYEQNRYEVVRCRMRVQGVKEFQLGLTFRFKEEYRAYLDPCDVAWRGM